MLKSTFFWDYQILVLVETSFAAPLPSPQIPILALLECPVKSLDRDRQGEEGPLIVFRRKFMAGRKQPGEATPMASQPVKVLAKHIESYNGST